MWEHIVPIAVGGGFIVNLLITVAVVTRTLSRIEAALTAAINLARDEIEEKHERDIKAFGETASAIRQKIHDIETWNRDTFVRKDSFYKVKDELSSELKSFAEKIDKRFDRMETKIDSKT